MGNHCLKARREGVDLDHITKEEGGVHTDSGECLLCNAQEKRKPVYAHIYTGIHRHSQSHTHVIVAVQSLSCV